MSRQAIDGRGVHFAVQTVTADPVQRLGVRIAAATLATVLATVAGPALAQPSPGADASKMQGQVPADAANPGPAAIASDSDSAAEPIPDPWSNANHAFFRLTRSVDKAVIAPAFRAYNRVVPKPVRNGLDNAIQNLDEPRTAANDILQGRFKGAGNATARFAINSTFGLAGLFDLAGKSGMERQESDFGQTLGRYGVKSGPYIFVPFAGPSSLRDGVGRLVDIFADPVGLIAGGLGTTFGDVRAGVAAVGERSGVGDQLQQVDQEFTDPYATVRSVYSQQRASQIGIAQGRPQNDVGALPDFGPPPPPTPAPDQAKPAPPSPQ
jgi:phospholipid-binding lipoprotein MlaA